MDAVDAQQSIVYADETMTSETATSNVSDRTDEIAVAAAAV